VCSGRQRGSARHRSGSPSRASALSIHGQTNHAQPEEHQASDMASNASKQAADATRQQCSTVPSAPRHVLVLFSMYLRAAVNQRMPRMQQLRYNNSSLGNLDHRESRLHPFAEVLPSLHHQSIRELRIRASEVSKKANLSVRLSGLADLVVPRFVALNTASSENRRKKRLGLRASAPCPKSSSPRLCSGTRCWNETRRRSTRQHTAS
jgi:hypothetical protein